MDIKLDQTGICIDGTYRELLASSLFYFRIPHERWDDRMKLLKAAGYNTIDVYFPWNYHETEPDVWEFAGNRDVQQFLSLAAQNQLFVIARPGPYICSEWDGGGLPAWLWEQGISVRQDDPEFLNIINNWYDHILPIIKKYQITRGGTVICMQIENELDFYKCISPVSYMEKLKTKAESLGIEVPLFYCCGQNDLLRGGGLTPGLYTAFNVYSDECNRHLEERTMHLYHSVQERNMPFLVTETNRTHGYLKRLLATGARLLSPYNQTAGTTMDYYNGITNWGPVENPVALMATDYDFDSMIGSAGDVTEEFTEARLLAGLIHCLGEQLATAKPLFDSDIKFSGENTNSMIPTLEMKCGRLIEVSNFGSAGYYRLYAGEEELSIYMKERETKLLPLHIKINDETTLLLSNYEIAYMEKTPDTTLCLYGENRLEIFLQAGQDIVKIDMPRAEERMEFNTCGIHFIAGSNKDIAYGHIPCLPDIHENILHQKKIVTDYTLMQEDVSYRSLFTKSGKVNAMETFGQYRGIGRYTFRLPAHGMYLLEKAADIITVRQNDRKHTFYSNGTSRPITLDKGSCEIQTEIWGHSNFDDIRCASLRMGSLKGMEKIIQIIRQEDLTESWLFDLDEGNWKDQYFFRHSPYNTMMGIDNYNRAVSPVKAVYTRYIYSSPEEDSLVLHFSKADCMIAVYINGKMFGTVEKNDPYLDISNAAGTGRIELTLRTIRRYYTDQVGQVTLYAGKHINQCEYSQVEPIATGTATNIQLPIHFTPYSEHMLTMKLAQHTRGDLKLCFKGRDLKLTVYAGGHVMGRLVLENKEFPVIAGGKSDITFLCREWTEKEDIIIWCQAIGKDPVLEAIDIAEYLPIINTGI